MTIMTAIQDRPRLTVPINQYDHVIGPSTATVTLLEYGDYECPYCRAAFGTVEQVRELFAEDLRFAYRHFPLTQIHPHALEAAIAAEGAAAEGRFWEMHAILFANQERLTQPDLLRYAQILGLDPVRFRNHLMNRTFEARVRRDFLSGVRSGVNGTPTFFINDVRHNGGWDLPSLVDAIRSEL
jgi:protein-disulfide isomerase